jgi:hypothetical protein
MSSIVGNSLEEKSSMFVLTSSCNSWVFAVFHNKAGNKARKTKSQRDKDRYRKLKSLTQRTTREAYNDYVTNIISPEQTNTPKRFWSFIKSKKQDNSGVAPLCAKDGVV